MKPALKLVPPLPSPEESFYADLPAATSFGAVTDFSQYRAVPESWHIVMTDIRGSTQAIEAGRYKDVNTLGAATIISVLNALDRLDVPFVFGGDGATLLVPSVALGAVRRALVSTQVLARESFNLELRAGIVPVARVTKEGHAVLVAKIRISENYFQAALAGGGAARAEVLLKDENQNSEFLIEAQASGTAMKDDAFDGLECRWSDIRVPQKEILSLLVVARGNNRAAVYDDTLKALNRIFDAAALAPTVPNDSLKLSFAPGRLLGEAKARTAGQGIWALANYLMRALLENVLGYFFFKRPGVHMGTDWQKYKRDTLLNTDSKKFDDTLRMILPATKEQKRALEAYLEERAQRGTLFYGLHAASHALMTCLVFDTKGRHVHFVDGGDGGYAAAAKGLKAQMKAAG